MFAGFDFADVIKIAPTIFIVVFLLNVLPAFAPPTWAVVSFVGLTIPAADFVWLPLVAAVAATSGRIVLAKLSRALVRQRLLSERTRRNIDTIRVGIQRRPALSFGALLGYSFSPLPSNYLFIAYGLTAQPIAFLALPFFIGRLVSYAFWIRTASTVGDWLDIDLDWLQSAPYFAIYFILSQLLLAPVIYSFTRLDWRALIVEGRFKWLERTS